MPPRNGPKDSKAFRQTTLLDNTKSTHASSISPVKQNNRPTESTSKKRSMKATPTPESSSDEIYAIKMTPASQPIIISSSSDEEQGLHAPVPSKNTMKKREKTHVSSDSGSSNAVNSEHNDNPTRKRLRKRHSSHNSEGEEELASKRPSRLRRKISLKESSSSDDIAQLAHEVDEERILNERLRTRTKTDYQINLDRLKKRKTKKGGKLGTADTPDEDEQEDSDEGDTKLELFQGSKPTITVGDDDGSASDSEQSSTSFIVEDEESVQLPAEFSMETHEDLSHQFKKIFQFFVHIAIQSQQNRAKFMKSQMKDEQYFSVPLQVTRRKISGLRDSLVSSSVWRPDFIKCLERYPEFETVPLDFAVPSCDACHLGGRMSKFLGRLNGSPYNQFGFEEIPPNLSDEEPSHEFHLGRFCAERTRVFHEFCHWEYSLFHNILRQIDGLRNATSSRTFHTVAFSGGRAPPEDLEDADGLCDWLDERRVVEMEWQKIKKMMESARHLDLANKRGDTDD